MPARLDEIDRDRLIVTVCRSGAGSGKVAAYHRSAVDVLAKGQRHVIDVHTIETTSLGDRSYLVTDGDVAVVIDPQRDLDRVSP